MQSQRMPTELPEAQKQELKRFVESNTIVREDGQRIVEPKYHGWWVVFNQDFTWHTQEFDRPGMLLPELCGSFGMLPEESVLATRPSFPGQEEARVELEELKEEQDASVGFYAVITPDGSLMMPRAWEVDCGEDP